VTQGIDIDQRLSPHFTLRELVVTHHRHLDNTPTPEVIERLARLCVAFLEPVRKRFGPLYVTSGYRSPEVNRAVGGSKVSAHQYGCAADFVSMNGHSTIAIVDWVVDVSGLPFDQVIDEYSSTSNWVHLGAVRPVGRQTPRHEAMTMRGGVYAPFR